MPRSPDDSALNPALMDDVDDDLFSVAESSPRPQGVFSRRATSGEVTPALGLARAALMLCAVFAVSTLYLLVSVHSHASTIESLQQQLTRYQVPQSGQVWVDRTELDHALKGLTSGMDESLEVLTSRVDRTQCMRSCRGFLAVHFRLSARPEKAPAK